MSCAAFSFLLFEIFYNLINTKPSLEAVKILIPYLESRTILLEHCKREKKVLKMTLSCHNSKTFLLLEIQTMH